MKIVIDIPEEEYERMKEQSMFGRVDVWKRAIKNGTPLPKQQPCEDAISREEALKIMCDSCPMYNCVTKCSSYTHIEKLPSVTPQQAKWIPVSERLPEENIHVLCQFYMGGMAECYHAHDYWHIVGGFRIKIDDVLAWMPLPQPYKAESEEEDEI